VTCQPPANPWTTRGFLFPVFGGCDASRGFACAVRRLFRQL